MKKVYDETLLKNDYAHALAQRLFKEQRLTPAQYEQIKKLHAEQPYSPNFFVKILLFLFGCVAFGFGGSFLSLFLLGAFTEAYAVTSLLYGFTMLLVLLSFIKQRKLYFSGIDNAFIYGILGCCLPLLFNIYDILKIQEIWVGALIMLPLFLLCVYFFGEPLVALGAFLLAIFVMASLAMKHPLGKALLPFILMLCSGVAYAVLRRFEYKPHAFYWQIATRWVQIAALIVAYLSGNYYVVREANAALNNLPSPAPEIAFASIFWTLTFLIPVAYLYMGFRWRQILLLVLGLLGLIGAGVTVRMYHALLPLEWALVLGGGVCVGLTIGFIRLLKAPRLGFSYEPESTSRVGLETMILSQLTKNNQSADHGVQLGEGDFGGGGAGEKY